MQRFQHLMVCLTRSESDFGLIRYAAMLARLDTATEVRFVHVLPAPQAGSPAHEHDRALQELEQTVGEAFLNVPDYVKVHCDVLKGPLSDRHLEFAAEQRGRFDAARPSAGPSTRTRVAGSPFGHAGAVLDLDRARWFASVAQAHFGARRLLRTCR